MSLDSIGAQDYAFASTGIEDFMNDFSTPLQNSNISLEDGLEELEDYTDDVELSTPIVDVQQTAAAAKATGMLLATVTDSTVPAILCAIAKCDDVTKFKADPSERKELETAWTNYCRIKGGDIPPGVALMLALGGIYGTKIPMAMMMSKKEKRGE